MFRPERQREGEIEIIDAVQNRVVLAGEAKWSREPVGLGVSSHLREVLRSVRGAGTETQLVLFGREFDPRL